MLKPSMTVFENSEVATLPRVYPLGFVVPRQENLEHGQHWEFRSGGLIGIREEKEKQLPL